MFIFITSVSTVMGADPTMAIPAPGSVVIPAYNYVIAKLIFTGLRYVIC